MTGYLENGTSGRKAGWAPDPILLIAGYAALFSIACIPLFAFETLPLGDMPNHLARAYILGRVDGDPLLQKFYAVDWRLFSFQSTDLILPWLVRLFGLSLGHQLFVAAAFTLLIGGTMAIHRALFGHIGLWPAAAFLFLYNFSLTLGQVSFLFSTGIGLLLFAAWIATAQCPRILRLPFFVVASFGLLLCHFFAFAAYALLIMAQACGQAWRMPGYGTKLRVLLEAGLPFVVPSVCFLASFTKTITGGTYWGDILAKSVPLLSPVITYARWPDFALAIAVILALWWLNRRRRLSFATGMRLPLLVLVLAAIAMPRLLQGVLGADLRLPCMLAFLLVAASELRFGSKRQAVAFGAGIFVLLGLRVGTTAAQWAHFDADYREFRAADEALPRGSRVMVIPIGPDLRAEPQPRLPYWFVGCLAVIDRQIFMPLLYTEATPLVFTPQEQAIYGGEPAQGRTVRWHPADPAFAAVDPDTVLQVEQAGQRMSDEDIVTSRIDWSDWPERFDYAIDFHMGRDGNPVPALLTEIRRGSYFAIYRIHPPKQP